MRDSQRNPLRVRIHRWAWPRTWTRLDQTGTPFSVVMCEHTPTWSGFVDVTIRREHGWVLDTLTPRPEVITDDTPIRTWEDVNLTPGAGRDAYQNAAARARDNTPHRDPLAYLQDPPEPAQRTHDEPEPPAADDLFQRLFRELMGGPPA